MVSGGYDDVGSPEQVDVLAVRQVPERDEALSEEFWETLERSGRRDEPFPDDGHPEVEVPVDELLDQVDEFVGSLVVLPPLVPEHKRGVGETRPGGCSDPLEIDTDREHDGAFLDGVDQMAVTVVGELPEEPSRPVEEERPVVLRVEDRQVGGGGARPVDHGVCLVGPVEG